MHFCKEIAAVTDQLLLNKNIMKNLNNPHNHANGQQKQQPFYSRLIQDNPSG